MLAVLLAVVSSVIGYMDKPPAISEDQINCDMIAEMSCCKSPLRVMSFNMLLDCHDKKLPQEHRWPQRRTRLIEYIRHVHPDIIGSQELQENQREYFLEELGDTYCMLGGEEAIFYNKERLELVCGRQCGRITLGMFKDKKQSCSFTLINTHLSFSSVEKRLAEAKQLAKIIKTIDCPVIVTGDMNTFPMRPNIAIPFYDGDYIVNLIEQSGVRDARLKAQRGHFGLISTTNFSSETFECFACDGEPGVILDHIFVSKDVTVKTHAIDPARVDGHCISDHFPVIADVVIHDLQK